MRSAQSALLDPMIDPARILAWVNRNYFGEWGARHPFLMFAGDAEAAMTLYCSAVPNSSFEVIERYPAGEDGTLPNNRSRRDRIG